MNRDLAQAARRFADQQSGRIADPPADRPFLATVTDFTAGVVSVEWRGKTLTANAYAASYTPADGDRVVCQLIDSQLIVMDTVV